MNVCATNFLDDMAATENRSLFGFVELVLPVHFVCFQELKGSTLPQVSGEKSLLWCEVFFIPPMPEDVDMPPQPIVSIHGTTPHW